MKKFILVIFIMLFGFSSAYGFCRIDISFIEIPSIDISQQPPTPIIIKGKLKLPTYYSWIDKECRPRENLPAVVFLHGSLGADARGDFYARALNLAKIATLEIDMWEARGVSGIEDRPELPILTYPDAFASLGYLMQHPNIDANRIGVMGFSWGAVITMASATEEYATQFGGDLRFAAHVAQYPSCWGYNLGFPGGNFFNLTGSPLLIQVGELDDYDEGPEPCFALKATLTPEEQEFVDIIVYPDAHHGFDGLLVPIEVEDIFAHRGAGGIARVWPNVEQAYESRKNVLLFFINNL